MGKQDYLCFNAPPNFTVADRVPESAPRTLFLFSIP